jgi:hypothetical protein
VYENIQIDREFQMKFVKISAVAVCVASFAAATVEAAPVLPTSYSMDNGVGQSSGGTYNYWDKEYTGAGSTTTDDAFLSGGLGNLTDGVVAADNWYVVENGAGTGPYVGWIQDPVIDFFFAALTRFVSATFYFDDADGFGGVEAPSKVRINGTDYIVADPAGPEPFAFTANLAGLTDNELNVQLFRNDVWVFLSEVTFEVAPVPVPAAGFLMLGALGGLAALRRRQRTV